MEVLQFNIMHAQEYQKRHYDEKHSKPPEIVVGDMVWLSRQNIRTHSKCNKLEPLRIGPFKVIAKVNEVTFKLELPESMKIHPVFHVSLLEKFHGNEDPNAPLSPTLVINQDEYIVNKILDSKVQKGKVYYLIDWLGYDESERSWEPQENVLGSNAVDVYYKRNPKKWKAERTFVETTNVAGGDVTTMTTRVSNRTSRNTQY